MKLAGKVAIVTAAGRGIGRAIALNLAAEGADVVVNSFREETAASVANEIEALGRKVLALPGDVTKANKVVKVVQDAIDTFGRIDILVNNVGGGTQTPKEPGSGILGQVEAEWDGMYEQNLKATVLMCQAVIPHMKEQKRGKIVNISSIAGRFTQPGLRIPYLRSAAYSAMKAGLISYTRVLAERVGPDNINVNCVCPGIVYTDAWKRNSQRVIEIEPEFKGMDLREWFIGIAQGKYPHIFLPTPLRREQTVEDIAHAVVFLVSDDSMNITGQTLNVDGGMIKS